MKHYENMRHCDTSLMTLFQIGSKHNQHFASLLTLGRTQRWVYSLENSLLLTVRLSCYSPLLYFSKLPKSIKSQVLPVTDPGRLHPTVSQN